MKTSTVFILIVVLGGLGMLSKVFLSDQLAAGGPLLVAFPWVAIAVCVVLLAVWHARNSK